MDILIIGGAGFIGSQLSLFYRNKGYNVTVYDNFTRNSLKFFNSDGIKVVQWDITNLTLPIDADIIIHCAGICGIHSVSDVTKVLEVNFIGTRNVIKCLTDRCKRYIFLSTTEVEGLAPKSYQFPLFEPRWAYAISKISAEYYCIDQIDKGIPITIVRPANVFGIGQIDDSAVSNFITHGLTDRKFTLYDDGLAKRAWCYIDDFISGIDLILNSDSAIGTTYTIGNPTNIITNVGLLRNICKMLDINPIITYKPHFCTDIKFRCPDIKNIKALGLEPKISLEQGLKRTIEWYINTFIGV